MTRRRPAVRLRPLRHLPPRFAAAVRRHDRGRHREQEDGARCCSASTTRCPSPSGSSRWARARAPAARSASTPTSCMGVDKIVPVDVYVPGLPAAARIDAVRVHAAAEEDRREDAGAARCPRSTAAERPRRRRRRRARPRTTGARRRRCASRAQDVAGALAALCEAAGYDQIVDLFGTDTGEDVEITYHLRVARARCEDVYLQVPRAPTTASCAERVAGVPRGARTRSARPRRCSASRSRATRTPSGC